MSNDPLQELEAGLDRWGGELARWPAAEARSARALLERSPAARALQEQALELERDLTSLRPEPLPELAKAQILERAAREARPEAPAAARGPVARLWRGALAACLPLLAGYLVGASSAYNDDARYADAVSELVFTASFEETIDD